MIYTILSNIKYQGTIHLAGEEIEVDENDAKLLLKDGLLKAIKEPEKAPKETKKIKKDTK